MTDVGEDDVVLNNEQIIDGAGHCSETATNNDYQLSGMIEGDEEAIRLLQQQIVTHEDHIAAHEEQIDNCKKQIAFRKRWSRWKRKGFSRLSVSNDDQFSDLEVLCQPSCLKVILRDLKKMTERDRPENVMLSYFAEDEDGPSHENLSESCDLWKELLGMCSVGLKTLELGGTPDDIDLWGHVLSIGPKQTNLVKLGLSHIDFSRGRVCYHLAELFQSDGCRIADLTIDYCSFANVLTDEMRYLGDALKTFCHLKKVVFYGEREENEKILFRSVLCSKSSLLELDIAGMDWIGNEIAPTVEGIVTEGLGLQKELESLRFESSGGRSANQNGSPSDVLMSAIANHTSLNTVRMSCYGLSPAGIVSLLTTLAQNQGSNLISMQITNHLFSSHYLPGIDIYLLGLPKPLGIVLPYGWLTDKQWASVADCVRSHMAHPWVGSWFEVNERNSDEVMSRNKLIPQLEASLEKKVYLEVWPLLLSRLANLAVESTLLFSALRLSDIWGIPSSKNRKHS